MAAWDDRLAWKLFTGRCRYCGVECRGVTCAAHADLPRLELLPVQRCPRCEGYDMEYHTYRGECSADPNCPHGIAVDAYCPKCDGSDIIRDSGRPSAHAAASTRRGAVLPPENDSAGSIPNGRPDNVLALLEQPVQRSVGTVDEPAGELCRLRDALERAARSASGDDSGHRLLAPLDLWRLPLPRAAHGRRDRDALAQTEGAASRDVALTDARGHTASCNGR